MTTVVIAGSRDWTDGAMIFDVLRTREEVDTVWDGECRGADEFGYLSARLLRRDSARWPANWDRYGRSAGPVRNGQMVKARPDEIWIFHHEIGNSKGSRDLAEQAIADGIPVTLFTPSNPTGSPLHELESLFIEPP